MPMSGSRRGADLKQIDGIDVMTPTTILSETGLDMSKWPDEKHFVPWLRLCPDNRISGNKIIGKGRLPTNNRACIALRVAASTLRTSQTYLVARFRRLRTKPGAPIAIKDMAAKLARLVYRMLQHGKKYVDLGMEFYEAQQPHKQIHYLKRKGPLPALPAKPVGLPDSAIVGAHLSLAAWRASSSTARTCIASI